MSIDPRSFTATKSMSAPARLGGTEEVAADASETVDADSDRHDWVPPGRVGERRCPTSTVVRGRSPHRKRLSATTSRWRHARRRHAGAGGPPTPRRRRPTGGGHRCSRLRPSGSCVPRPGTAARASPSRASNWSTNCRAGGGLQHEVAHLGVVAGQRAQVVLPVRVRQEPHVHHDVGVERQAVLEPEALDRDLQPRPASWCRRRGRCAP